MLLLLFLSPCCFQQLRGLAMSILNSGIAIGYALAYGLGFLKEAAGWRWAYWVAGSPGVIVAVIMLFTLPNPDKLIQVRETEKLSRRMRRGERARGLHPLPYFKSSDIQATTSYSGSEVPEYHQFRRVGGEMGENIHIWGPRCPNSFIFG